MDHVGTVYLPGFGLVIQGDASVDKVTRRVKFNPNPSSIAPLSQSDLLLCDVFAV